MATEIVKIEHGRNRLRLVPEVGGGIASWDWKAHHGWTPVLRPWDELTRDRYTLAGFPLTPWSNRITQGGFDHDGVFHPVKPNREGEPYPIHGDGWLQRWHVSKYGKDHVQLILESHHFDGNPYEHVSTLDFRLLPDGLEIDQTVTHRGDATLPYGLGFHPYFLRDEKTRLRFKASGVWLASPDAIPFEHTQQLPETWDYNEFATLEGGFIDNCFTGWDGTAVIDYPNRGFAVTMSMENCNGYTLFYRPPNYDYFCLEPITHPIDAFHMPDRPGLVSLGKDQTLTLKTRFLLS